MPATCSRWSFHDFPETCFVRTHTLDSALLTQCFEVAFDGTGGLVEQAGHFLGRQSGFLCQKRQNLIRYTDIYTDIADSLCCDINVLVQRIRQGIEHKVDERAAIHRAGMRILQRLVIQRLVVVNQRLNRHPGKQRIPLGKNQRLPQPFLNGPPASFHGWRTPRELRAPARCHATGEGRVHRSVCTANRTSGSASCLASSITRSSSLFFSWHLFSISLASLTHAARSRETLTASRLASEIFL